MLGSRAFWALMRRNVVYRRRNWIGTLAELVLPMAFVGFLYAIKVAVRDSTDTGYVPPNLPDNEQTWIPLSFADYVVALQAQRQCYRDPYLDRYANNTALLFFLPDHKAPEFTITGRLPLGYGWPVPLVKCNSLSCDRDGQDAQPFCEYGMIAVSGSTGEDWAGRQRARDFVDWVYQQYPVLNQTQYANWTADQRRPLPFTHDLLQVFNSSDAMSNYVQAKEYGDGPQHPKIVMGIVWDGNDGSVYRYSLRPNSTNFNAPEWAFRPASLTTPDTRTKLESYARHDNNTCALIDGAPNLGPMQSSCSWQYMYNGVLTMQRLVHDYIMDRTGAAQVGLNVSQSGLRLAPFPSQGYMASGFFTSIGEAGPLLIILGLLYPVAAMIGYVVREKELRQKELMKMMSVTESDIGWSWFLTFWLLNIAAAFLATIMATWVYAHSDVLILLIFWMLATLSTTVFAMTAATFSTKTTRAVLIGLLTYFSGVFLTLALDYKTLDPLATKAISLHPLAAFSFALQEAGRLEDLGVGLQRETITHTDVPSGYTFADMLQSLAFDNLWWGVAAWYFVRVMKPEYGQAFPFYFPFTLTYWFPNRRLRSKSEALSKKLSESALVNDDNDDVKANPGVPMEIVSDALKRQAREQTNIEIKGLRKHFGEKIAVDGLTLSIYNGQITALLGHNGAGKTTTIGMLTGALAPTEGTATIGGLDVRTQLPQIRREIGICLQHDCLFPQLTVREHVQFFARIKGIYSKVPRREAEEHIDEAIQDVALSEKRNTLSRNLSGGMKRKLSVAIAFCGGSKFVLLDEPTSGMDPFSRRFTWNVIRNYRQDRCIILTTHFMDEADILGDRIAIMAEGQLRCAGSSLFLKKVYGVGYQLTIEKSRSGHTVLAVVEPVTALNSVEAEPPDASAADENMLSLDESEKGGDEAEEGAKEQENASVANGGPMHRRDPDGLYSPFEISRPALDVEGEKADRSLTTNVDGSVELIDLVNKMLRNASLATRDDFRNGNVVPKPDQELQSIYEKELAFVLGGREDIFSANVEHAKGDSKLNEIFHSREYDSKLQRIVSEAVSEAALLTNVGSEISFQLPIGASSRFPHMFQGLDAEIEAGRISSYGVSITTLEEVFLLVARGASHEKEQFASSRSHDRFDQDVRTDRSYHSRMNLEKEGLFWTHVTALFRKRAMNFQRDKKAWICTTFLPSVFVAIGFCIFKFASPQRNLPPVLLDLNDYNSGVTTTPRNPVTFNNPGNPYTCQPGQCAYPQYAVNETATDELYFFCGTQTLLDGGNTSCSISESDNFTMPLLLDSGGAVPIGVDVQSVFESSSNLLNSSNEFVATQYGAVFFSNDRSSALLDGSSYRSRVQSQCSFVNALYANYTSAEECHKFNGVGYVIQYNFTALHVAPLFQILSDEALIRTAVGRPNISIEGSIAPLPITSVEEGFGKGEDGFSAWFLVILSFPFISGAFGSFVVLERQSKAKHLQTVAGVKPSAYWLSTYFWDILNYQIPMWITVLLMFAFRIDILTTNTNDVVTGVITVLILYGPASAGFTYCVSYLFTSASLCNIFVIMIGFLIGMGGALACYILLILGVDPKAPKPHLVNVSRILSWCLRVIFPPFCLGKSLFYAINIQTFAYLEEDLNLSVWTEPVLLYEVVLLALQSVVYVAFVIHVDIWATNPRIVSAWQRIIKLITLQCLFASKGEGDIDITTALPDDDDVVAEEQRVLSGQTNGELIVVSQLRKVYDNGKIAVNNISFGIPHGECFGLLGINGAGKTTTMQMLTAEFPPTSGDATLAGYSVRHQPEKTRRRIGYCPQFDAHFPNMTGREHVELYASIKGVPREYIKEAAAAKLAEVGLSVEDSDRLSSGYSGGMKRRLSLACATIGQPQILFLDECSTGVDPVARREIWKLISDIVSGGDLPLEERTSVILTTHSMEECEALCPRIAIMANGRLRCIGSAQHLKSKFGQGYQVELKVKLVDQHDDDYVQAASVLRNWKFPTTDAESGVIEEAFFTLAEAKSSLDELTQDNFLSEMLTPDNQIGYPVYKDAMTSTGVAIESLAAFAATETRMRAVAHFIEEHFPRHLLRERQEGKVRYEVSSEGVRISAIFASIEENKDRLWLADYGVSQTSLEQVFNMHAAEAERLKQGRNDK